MIRAPVLLSQGRGRCEQQRCHRDRLNYTCAENTRPQSHDLRADVTHGPSRLTRSNHPLAPSVHRFAATLDGRQRCWTLAVSAAVAVVWLTTCSRMRAPPRPPCGHSAPGGGVLMACSGGQSILRWTNYGDGVAGGGFGTIDRGTLYHRVHRSATSSDQPSPVGPHP